MPSDIIASLSDEERWQVEQDARTLKEAGMIKKDEARLEKAMALMAEEMDAMGETLEMAARKRFGNTDFKNMG